MARYQSQDAKIAAVSGGKITAQGYGETAVVATYLHRSAMVKVAVPQSLPDAFPKMEANNKIDDLVYAKLKELGIPPSDLCTDQEFLRRVSLDVIGTLPKPEEARAFLADNDPQNWAGQCMLLARHLVEADCGAKVIKIFWERGGGAFGGWDTHDDAQFPQQIANQMDFDQGMSALFEDLSQRGLLESTIVLAGGEMGRQPCSQSGKAEGPARGTGGRGHHSVGFSWIVGGGRFKGGRVVGKTNRFCQVIERPVYPWDLWASVYALLGIDPADTLPYPLGCNRVRVSPLPPTSREMRDLEDWQKDEGDAAIQPLAPYPRTNDRVFGGLLTEIM